MRATQISFTIILSALSLATFAEPAPGVTVFPQVGLISYSGTSNIEIDPDYGLGVGLSIFQSLGRGVNLPQRLVVARRLQQH